MEHDYKIDCMCYRCKGIRNSPTHKPTPKKRVVAKTLASTLKASRSEQYGRYLDCGPSAWDDRD